MSRHRSTFFRRNRYILGYLKKPLVLRSRNTRRRSHRGKTTRLSAITRPIKRPYPPPFYPVSKRVKTYRKDSAESRAWATSLLGLVAAEAVGIGSLYYIL